MRSKNLAALSSILLSLTAHEAVASGFMGRENNAEGVAMAQAGNASRADDPATVFNNPAGMVRLSDPAVEIGAVGFFPSFHFSGSATAAGTIPISGTQGGQSGQAALIPNFYVVAPLSDRLWAGLAVTVPYGDTINYKSMFVGRYQGIKSFIVSADINPNIAWKITDKVSVGGGISAQWLKVEDSAAIPQFLIAKAAVPDAVYMLNGSSWAVGYNLGLLLQPTDVTRLGFTWRSGIDHKLTGSLDFTNALIPVASGPATASGVDLPGIAAVSFTHDFTPQWSASAEMQYDLWSSFKQVTVTSQNPPLLQPEHYRDSWMFSVGGAYRPMTQLALRAGIGWDQSPVSDRYRTVGIPDTDRLMLGVGAGYSFAPGVVVDLSYAHYLALGHSSVTGSVNSVDPFTHAVVLTGDYNNNTADYVAIDFKFAL